MNATWLVSQIYLSNKTKKKYKSGPKINTKYSAQIIQHASLSWIFGVPKNTTDLHSR